MYLRIRDNNNIMTQIKNKQLELIRDLIQREINKLRTNDNYYASLESYSCNTYILMELKDKFGFDYNCSEELVDYCLGATDIEIWEYYISSVLPSIEIGLIK